MYRTVGNWGGNAMYQEVDAILMAAGFSNRFGPHNKLLQPFCGKPLIAHTLHLVKKIPFRRIFLVYAAPQILALAHGIPITALHNTNPVRGPCESVRLGVKASRAAYYLFFNCDQPLLDAATVENIVRARQPGCIVQPVQDGQPGAPTLFSSAFRRALLTLEDGQNPRSIKAQNPQCVVSVPAATPLALADIDTPKALQKLEHACGGRLLFTQRFT